MLVNSSPSDATYLGLTADPVANAKIKVPFFLFFSFLVLVTHEKPCLKIKFIEAAGVISLKFNWRANHRLVSFMQQGHVDKGFFAMTNTLEMAPVNTIMSLQNDCI